MNINHTPGAVAALAILAVGAAACTPASNEADAARDTDTTTIIEREAPAAPLVIEREVAAPAPPIIIETDRTDDNTTVRAGRDGIEVETTNR